MPKADHVFWDVAEDRNPVAATLPHNTILVVIPPSSFGRPLWHVQTRGAPPPHSQVALFTGVRGRVVLRSSLAASRIVQGLWVGKPSSPRFDAYKATPHVVVPNRYARGWIGGPPTPLLRHHGHDTLVTENPHRHQVAPRGFLPPVG